MALDIGKSLRLLAESIGHSLKSSKNNLEAIKLLTGKVKELEDRIRDLEDLTN